VGDFNEIVGQSEKVGYASCPKPPLSLPTCSIPLELEKIWELGGTVENENQPIGRSVEK
jgi:hypothetical protein